jgi:hypothetical protein
MKTHDEKQIRDIFKRQKYKYASLKNEDGKSIVTYNTENNPKVTAAHKLDEAFERLTILPDGFYTFCFANSKGRNVQPDEFVFMKGHVAIDEKGNRQNYQIIQQHSPKNDYDKILSYPEVLQLQMQVTTLKFQLDATNKELAKANAEIIALEAELKELENKGLGEGDASRPMKWVEMLGTQLMPVVDRIAGIKEKENELRSRELSLEEQGKRISPRNPGQAKAVRLPTIGSPAWEQWLDQLAALNDEQYDKAMANINAYSPEHYNAIVEELEGEEEEEQE